jgi:PTH1 family peptidyl-tRNA hydrolase
MAAETQGVAARRVDLIVGLGNPGPRYRYTRHNVGFDVIDVLARQYDIPMRQHEARAICGKGCISDCAVLLVKPQTYMNASGPAVAPLVKRYLQGGEHMMVIHDDIDLPLGAIRIKRRGGDAGHRGVRSIIECLGNGDFVRLRLGIGRPPHREDIVDYVLASFAADEMQARDLMITQAASCVVALLAAADRPCEL